MSREQRKYSAWERERVKQSGQASYTTFQSRNSSKFKSEKSFRTSPNLESGTGVPYDAEFTLA